MANTKITDKHNTILKTVHPTGASFGTLTAAINQTALASLTPQEVERQARVLGLIKGDRSNAN